jgi:tetratricopeptide (TPR) repeat protein
VGWIYAYPAGAYQHLIDFEESNRWSQRNVELGEREGVPSVSAMGFEFFMENAFMGGFWRECLEHVARHREVGEKARSSDRLAWNHLGLANANHGLGNLAEAENACDQGLDLADRLGDQRLATFLMSWKALIAGDTGRVDEAIALADAAVERGDALGLKTGQLDSRRARALIAQRRGNHEAALELAAEAENLLEGTDEALFLIWWSPTLCRSLIATGQFDEAGLRLAATLAATRRSNMPHWEGMALVVRGQLHAARGDDDAARRDVDAAIEIFEELGSRLELARALVVRAGLPDEPDTDMRRARELFEACGAVAS